MAKQVLTNAKVWYGGYDLSGDLNAIALKVGVDAKPADTFGADTHVFLPGLRRVDAQHEGLVNAGTGLSDAALFANIGAAATPMTMSPGAGAAGDLAYFFLATEAQYTQGAPVGEVLRFSLAAAAGGGLVNSRNAGNLLEGAILHNATVTTTGTGTVVNLGDVGAGVTVHAALHVLAVSGVNPTLDVIIQSDSGAGMATPVSRITFAQQVAVGSVWWNSTGGIGDTHWRVSYTVGGTGSPSFSFVVVLGLRP